MVTIDDNHNYTMDGVPAMGIHELFNFFGIGYCKNIPGSVLEPARDRGTKAHLMARYFIEGRLDENTVAPELQGYLEALKKLAQEHTIKPIAIEQPIGWQSLLIAGTPDLICEFDGRIEILDWKFTKKVMPETHLQLGAYRWIYNHILSVEKAEEGKEAGRGVIVHFTGDDYELVPVDEDAQDEFQTLLYAYHTIKKYGGIR